MKPVLSIVIVNSDGLYDTLQCLESIFNNPPDVSFVIVLVDNCSILDNLSIVKIRYPQIRVYSAPQRQGFAKNYNLGIRYTLGEFVIILNNDTIVMRGALNALIAAARQNPSYGMVGPQLISVDGSAQIDCARSLPTPALYVLTCVLLDPGMPTGRLWNTYLRFWVGRRRSGPVPCICGACILITRESLQQVGSLDEGYDFYYEDVEWCHRVQAHGKSVAYVAEAEITHLGDQSLSKVKVWAKQSEYRSALRYFRQYYALTSRQAWMIWFATTLSFLLRGTVFLLKEILSGEIGYARAYFYLWSWVLHQHPASNEIAALLRSEAREGMTIGGYR